MAENNSINYGDFNLIDANEYFDGIVIKGEKKVLESPSINRQNSNEPKILQGYNFSMYLKDAGKFVCFKRSKIIKKALRALLTDKSKKPLEISYLETCGNEMFLTTLHKDLFDVEINEEKLNIFNKMLTNGISRKAAVYIMASTACVSDYVCIKDFEIYENAYNKERIKKKMIGLKSRIKRIIKR